MWKRVQAGGGAGEGKVVSMGLGMGWGVTGWEQARGSSPPELFRTGDSPPVGRYSQ